MANKNIPLSELFASMQDQMSAQLSTNRDNITHPGSKGDALENAWIEWLRKYLPNRYSVDKAIVIDCNGDISHQIDVVIYDNWFTPFIFTQNGFHYIPAEGVYAIFEVKPDINGKVNKKSFIEYAGDKIESVRSLKRTSVDMINSGKTVNARPLTKIVGGILANESSIVKESTIKSHLKQNKNLKSIDFGCIADFGSFYIDYVGSEDTELKDSSKFEKRINDYYKEREFSKICFSKKENSLISFFMQLTRYLQQAIGTVPAINLNKYLESINEKIDEDI